MRQPLDIRLSRRNFLQMPLLASGLPLIFQNPANTGTVRFMSFDEAAPVIRSGKFMLPPDLARFRGEMMRGAWSQWVRSRDTEIRSRLPVSYTHLTLPTNSRV